MNANDLTIGTLLQSATESKVTHAIEDFMPAGLEKYRRWKVNNQWLNYAEIDARFRLWKSKKSKAA